MCRSYLRWLVKLFQRTVSAMLNFMHRSQTKWYNFLDLGRSLVRQGRWTETLLGLFPVQVPGAYHKTPDIHALQILPLISAMLKDYLESAVCFFTLCQVCALFHFRLGRSVLNTSIDLKKKWRAFVCFVFFTIYFWILTYPLNNLKAFIHYSDQAEGLKDLHPSRGHTRKSLC